MIRILIVDDHALVREGMRRILEQEPGLGVSAEAGDPEGMFLALEEEAVDVILLDVSIPGMGFQETLRRLRAERPEIPVLIVSMHAEEPWAIRAIRAGAAGYVNKNQPSEDLVEAIRRVHAGRKYVTDSLAETLAGHFSGQPVGDPERTLSKREYEVLRLLGSGRRVKSVADELGLSPKTVSTYRTRILEKLQLQNTAELIRYVVENGLQA